LEAERSSTDTLLLSMVISLPANAVPPLAPVSVAHLPLAEIERRMFSTDCSVKAVQLPHVLSKQPAVTLAGFQSSKTPAGKVVRAVQPCHPLSKSRPAFILQAPHETMLVMLRNA